MPHPHHLPAEPQALSYDPENSTGQRSKLLYRRGVAYMGMQSWEAAIEDLRDPVHGTDPAVVSKLKEAQASLKKEKDRGKKMWGGAFAKAASDGEGSAPSSPARAGAGAGSAASSVSTPASTGSGAGAGAGAGSAASSSGGRQSASALRAKLGEMDKEAEEVRRGLGSGNGDSTLEAEAEGGKESAGWGTYAVYGGIALGALAIGAYAFSKMRR
jgi:hypothetical protein